MPKNTSNKKSSSARGAQNPVKSIVRRIYEKSAPLLIGEAVLFAVAAIFLIVKPVAILTALTFVIGIVLILFGMYRTISGFVISQQRGGGWLDVVFGMINVVLGILFCIYPAGSLVSLVYVFVVLFLFKALSALVFAINMARARFGHYIFDLIMAIILVGLAVFLLFYPIAGAVAMIYYLAVILLLYAASDIYMYFELRRLKNEIA